MFLYFCNANYTYKTDYIQNQKLQLIIKKMSWVKRRKK